MTGTTNVGIRIGENGAEIKDRISGEELYDLIYTSTPPTEMIEFLKYIKEDFILGADRNYELNLCKRFAGLNKNINMDCTPHAVYLEHFLEYLMNTEHKSLGSRITYAQALNILRTNRIPYWFERMYRDEYNSNRAQLVYAFEEIAGSRRNINFNPFTIFIRPLGPYLIKRESNKRTDDRKRREVARQKIIDNIELDNKKKAAIAEQKRLIVLEELKKEELKVTYSTQVLPSITTENFVLLSSRHKVFATYYPKVTIIAKSIDMCKPHTSTIPTSAQPSGTDVTIRSETKIEPMDDQFPEELLRTKDATMDVQTSEEISRRLLRKRKNDFRYAILMLLIIQRLARRVGIFLDYDKAIAIALFTAAKRRKLPP